MESALLLVVLIILYFIPAWIASSRKHKSSQAITLVNLFFGWTVIGWLAALIWAYTGNVVTPEASPDTHVKCPDCAELVKREARVCKHCGCKLVPQ